MDFIRIDFEKGEGYYIYRDCLTLTQEQFHSLSEQDIEDMKEQRYQNWLYNINNPPPVTEEELQQLQQEHQE